MKQTISTSKGTFHFEPQTFLTGEKVIDKVISRDNLLLFQKIMNRHNIDFSLAYGTLLGAIRENDFISHDEDIDVAILEEDRNNLLDALFDFEKNGFSVGRYADDLLSVIRKGEYIDVYIFKKNLFGYRQFGHEILKEKYLTETTYYSFQGSLFKIPSEYIEYLETHYGKEWKIPKLNAHACNPGVYLAIKIFIRNHSNPLFKVISRFKKKIHYFKIQKY